MGGSYLGLLRHNRDFRLLYLATLISLAGDWFLTVALVDLVLDKSGKATLVGLITLCMCLPVFLLSPWAGATVDRTNRRRLMIVMDLVRAGAALLPLLATTPLRLPFAYVGVCIISICSAYFDPAADAALPNFVAPEDLGRANVLLGSAWGTMMAVGAALGGVVMFYAGRRAAFIIDGLSFLLSASLILLIRIPFSQKRTQEAPRVPMVESVRQTIRYARARPQVMALLLGRAGYGLGAGLVALIGLFGEKIFQRGPQGISFMLVARGAGVVLGPFLLSLIFGNQPGQSYRQCRAIAACVTLFALGYLGLAISPTLGFGMAAVALAHIGAGAQWQACTYGLQSVVPDHLRGRIFAADYGLLTLSLSISSMGAGFLADHYGVRQATLCLGLLSLAWALAWELTTRQLWSHPPPAEPPD